MDPDPGRRVRLPIGPALAIIAACALACGTQTPAPGSSAPPAGSSAIPGGSGGALPTGAIPSGDTPPYGGSGSVVIEDMAAGLDALRSYRSSLVVTFKGSDAAAPRAWTMTLVHVRSNDPAAASISVATTGTGAPFEPTIEVQRDGQTWMSLDGDCAVRPTAEAGSIAELLAPARLLASVVGADLAGRETIGGVEADHLTFDEAAVGLAGVADGTGELWVAASGGAVIKETLSLTGAGLGFGEDAAGTMTWAYELTDAGAAVSIDLPAGCTTSTLDLPVPPNATAVQRGPSVISFDTPSTPAQVVAFYRDAGTAAGWSFAAEPYAGAGNGLIEATVDGRAVTIVITGVAAGSSVVIGAQ